MSDKTFIEVWHDGEDCTYNLVATRTRFVWKNGTQAISESWQLNNSTLHIYDQTDIDALRKLLDAVEKEISEERN